VRLVLGFVEANRKTMRIVAPICRTLTSGSMILLVFAALLSAPFTHSHNHDGAHGLNDAALIHAHFPIARQAAQPDESTSVTGLPDLGHGKSVDIFISDDSRDQQIHVAVVESPESAIASSPERKLIVPASARSHDPPREPSVPARAPPILTFA
jgi:hypothetical protein